MTIIFVSYNGYFFETPFCNHTAAVLKEQQGSRIIFQEWPIKSKVRKPIFITLTLFVIV